MSSNLAPLGAYEVAEECLRVARLPSTDNRLAIVFFLARKFINELAEENVRLAHRNEWLEAERAS